MLLVDGDGTPIGAEIASASEAEVNLVEPLIDRCACDEVPGRLIYDKAADSNALRERLAAREIDLIAPHRKNRNIAVVAAARGPRRRRAL